MIDEPPPYFCEAAFDLHYLYFLYNFFEKRIYLKKSSKVIVALIKSSEYWFLFLILF